MHISYSLSQQYLKHNYANEMIMIQQKKEASYLCLPPFFRLNGALNPILLQHHVLLFHNQLTVSIPQF